MQDDAARPGRTLNGWKEVAAYLGKSVRSVQRWEAALGLPVRRIRTPDGQIVYADKSEIDEWRRYLDAPPVPEPEDPADPESLPESDWDPTTQTVKPSPLVAPRRAWMLTAAAALFASGMLAGWWLAKPSPIAVSLAFAGRSLQGLNQQGAVVWSHQFDRDVGLAHLDVGGSESPRPPLVDLDGDGAAEWLVPVRFSPRGNTADTSDAVYSLTQDGRLRWSFRADQRLTYPNRTMSAPWLVTDYAISEAPGRKVWVAFRHHTGSSSFVIELDASGNAKLRYVNFGTIYALSHWATPSGGFLAVGGVNAEHKRPVLVLMSENAPPATSPVDDPQRAPCGECPSGRPQRMFLFPASELSPAAHEFYPYVRNLQVAGTTLKITAHQGQGHSQFVLNSNFSFSSFQFTQQYWGAHKQLEVKGQIDHTAEECPDRFKPAMIREWTPGQGWRDSTVPPAPQPST